jgi:hypothetical protein
MMCLVLRQVVAQNYHHHHTPRFTGSCFKGLLCTGKNPLHLYYIQNDNLGFEFHGLELLFFCIKWQYCSFENVRTVTLC